MGTKKTAKPLEWLRPIEIDKKQSVWALNFLRRENKKLPLLSTDNDTIRSQDLGYWINQLQRHYSISKQDNASTADRLMANAIETIDTRMRYAWDAHVSRNKPDMKVYTFQMPKKTGAMLSALRVRWTKPKMAIVQALIEDAYSQEKQYEKLEKMKSKATTQKKAVDFQILKIRKQRNEAIEEAALFRELAKMLIWKMTETEYRIEHGLPATGVPDPSHVAAIEALCIEAMEGYKDWIESELSKSRVSRSKEAQNEQTQASYPPGGPMPGAFIKPRSKND